MGKTKRKKDGHDFWDDERLDKKSAGKGMGKNKKCRRDKKKCKKNLEQFEEYWYL